jgi:medium-chain acyl-[acyl-carrier-protein] hydrolase
MSRLDRSPWVRRLQPDSAGELRLFCFPHAGGGASFFADWPRQLPPEIQVLAVQLPGREERLSEPPFTRLQPLLGALITALRPHLVPPYAFFGHSMGTLLAFEVARQLREQGDHLPTHLIVSGRGAAGHARAGTPLSTLSDPELIAQLRQYQGTPAQVLDNPDFLKVLLPVLRADSLVCDTYRYESGEPLDCPVTAFGGDADPEATPEDLHSWKDLTSCDFAVRLFPGDHFYLKNNLAFFQALGQVLLGSPVEAPTAQA